MAQTDKCGISLLCSRQPSAKDYGEIPVIVSLHGSSEVGKDNAFFRKKFLVDLFNNWELEGFNAYIVCPHLTGNGYSNTWANNKSAENLFALLDHLVEELNIDPERIILQGHSLGGQGVLHMALYNPDYFSAIIPVSAAEYWLVFDDADLLTESEEIELDAKYEEIGIRHQMEIVAAVFETIGDFAPKEYADDFYDNNGYGYGNDKAGVLLLVCMDEREYRILSNGFAADAITMEYIDYISDAIVSDLSAGDYAAAFETFAEECDYYINGYINGFPFDFSTNLILALIVGLVIGLIVASTLKAQLKSVRRQNQANVYVKEGSMKITRSGDYFMYRTVTRTEKPKNNSSSSSHSGSSRNVGGGRF